MPKIDEFKIFVRENPKLLNFVKTGEMTWQKFYEMYDLYGATSDVWNNYLGVSNKINTPSNFNFSDIFKFIKTIDLDSIQQGVNSLQRVISVLGELGSSEKEKNDTTEYKPRPIYKHFED